jgi:hypothetical protein
MPVSKADQEKIDAMDHSRPPDAVDAPPPDTADAPPPDDDDAMFEDAGDPDDPSGPEGEDEATQLRYLADAPQWALVPPRAPEFANATWLAAERAAIALVHEVLAYEEFAPFAAVDIEVRWRRKSKPFHAWREPKPMFASVVVVDPRMIWEAEHHGTEDFPRLLVDLHWQHFVDRRSNSPFYVHGDEIKFDVHHALSALAVQNEGFRTVKPDVSGYAETVKRFGKVNVGIRRLARAAMLWPDDPAEDEAEEEG